MDAAFPAMLRAFASGIARGRACLARHTGPSLPSLPVLACAALGGLVLAFTPLGASASALGAVAGAHAPGAPLLVVNAHFLQSVAEPRHSSRIPRLYDDEWCAHLLRGATPFVVGSVERMSVGIAHLPDAAIRAIRPGITDGEFRRLAFLHEDGHCADPTHGPARVLDEMRNPDEHRAHVWEVFADVRAAVEFLAEGGRPEAVAAWADLRAVGIARAALSPERGGWERYATAQALDALLSGHRPEALGRTTAAQRERLSRAIQSAHSLSPDEIRALAERRVPARLADRAALAASRRAVPPELVVVPPAR